MNTPVILSEAKDHLATLDPLKMILRYAQDDRHSLAPPIPEGSSGPRKDNTTMARLHRDNALLIVIDVQEKLTAVIHEQEQLQRNIERLVRGCHILKVPALLTEQYPKGLGPTTEKVQGAFDETYGTRAVQKMCFSGYRCSEFIETIAPMNRKQVLVAGIETHVCVYQTVTDLLSAGYEVTVIADAVSSRTARNREIALERMAQEGAKWSSTEMALFELTVEAGSDEFKAISKLVK